MSKTESLKTTPKSVAQALIEECALSIKGAERVSGLSRSTVTKIKKGDNVKLSTLLAFTKALQLHKQTLETVDQEDGSSDALRALRSVADRPNRNGLENTATLKRKSAEDVCEFLKALSDTLDPEAPPKRNSEVYKFIIDAERIATEFNIIKRLMNF